MLARLGNINLFVRDIEASLRFYTDMLGLQHDAERSHPPGFALLRSGDLTITLQDSEAPGSVLGQSDSVELGFEADDLPVLRERIAAAGSDVTPLQMMGWGSGFDARDPNGFRLTIFSKREQSGASS